MDTTPEDLLALVYLLANRVAPAHEGVELGIGEAMIIKALAEAFGRTEKQVKKEYEVIAFHFVKNVFYVFIDCLCLAFLWMKT